MSAGGVIRDGNWTTYSNPAATSISPRSGAGVLRRLLLCRYARGALTSTTAVSSLHQYGGQLILSEPAHGPADHAAGHQGISAGGDAFDEASIPLLLAARLHRGSAVGGTSVLECGHVSTDLRPRNFVLRCFPTKGRVYESRRNEVLAGLQCAVGLLAARCVHLDSEAALSPMPARSDTPTFTEYVSTKGRFRCAQPAGRAGAHAGRLFAKGPASSRRSGRRRSFASTGLSGIMILRDYQNPHEKATAESPSNARSFPQSRWFSENRRDRPERASISTTSSIRRCRKPTARDAGSDLGKVKSVEDLASQRRQGHGGLERTCVAS